MSDPVWPSSLPQRPEYGGWNGTPKDDRSKFEPDVGVPLTRPRTTASVWQCSATFSPFTASQLSTLETFYFDTLKHGSLPFQWKDPLNGNTYRWKFETPYSFESPAYEYNVVHVSLYRMPGGPVIRAIWLASSTFDISESGYLASGATP